MWYVLQVAVGREDSLIPAIERALRPLGDCEVFTPHYLAFRKNKDGWFTERRTLFPGYVFVDTQKPDALEKRVRIFTTSVKAVCIGGGFYPIRPAEQEFLAGMMGASREIAVSIGEMIEGNLVVRQGPLIGHVGDVKKIDMHKRRAEVACSLWGEERRMRVGLEVRRAG